MAAPAKRIKIRWGQVALAVASHHKVLSSQEPIFLDPDPLEGGRIRSFPVEGEMSHRSEFIVPDLIENLPLPRTKSKFLAGSFFFSP